MGKQQMSPADKQIKKNKDMDDMISSLFGRSKSTPKKKMPKASLKETKAMLGMGKKIPNKSKERYKSDKSVFDALRSVNKDAARKQVVDYRKEISTPPKTPEPSIVDRLANTFPKPNMSIEGSLPSPQLDETSLASGESTAVSLGEQASSSVPSEGHSSIFDRLGNKTKEVLNRAIENKDAETAIGIDLSTKQRKKVLKNIDSPQKLKQIQKTVDAGKEPKGLTDQFTAALLHFTPQLVGMAAGALFEGAEGAVYGAQEGAKVQEQLQGLQDKEQAAQMAQQKADVEESRFNQTMEQHNLDRKAKLDMHAASLAQKESLADLANRYKATTGEAKNKQQLMELAVPYGNKVYTALNKEDKKKMTDGVEMVSKTKYLVNQIKALNKEYGGELFNREAISKANSLNTQLQLLLKGPAAFELGVLAGPDMDLLESVTGTDPLALFTKDSTIQAKYDALLDTVIYNTDAALQSRSMEGVEKAQKRQLIETELNRRGIK